MRLILLCFAITLGQRREATSSGGGSSGEKSEASSRSAGKVQNIIIWSISWQIIYFFYLLFDFWSTVADGVKRVSSSGGEAGSGKSEGTSKRSGGRVYFCQEWS